MVTRSQRHKEEIQGPFTPPEPPVVPTIVITSLSPNTGEVNQTMALAVLGTGLMPDDQIIFGGTTHESEYIFAGQINTLENDPIVTGAVVRQVPVYVKRGEEISNTLYFAVTEATAVEQSLFNRTTQVDMVGNADEPLTVGTVLRFTKAGQITHIWFWKPANDTANARSVGVYADAGAAAGSSPLRSGSTSGELAGPRWIKVPLSSPLDVTVGPSYVVAAQYPTAHYPAQPSYFAAADVVVGDIVGVQSSSNVLGNGRFQYGGAMIYPNQTIGQGCYFADVAFVAGP